MANPTAWSIDNNHGNYFRHEGDADRQIYRPIWAPRQDSSVPQNTSSSVETATPPINAYPSGGEYYSHYATQAQGHVNYPQSLQTPYSQYDSYNPSFNPRQGNNAPRQLYAVPSNVDSELPQNTITGTLGQFEALDSNYFVRPRTFFVQGKMFACLFTEGMGATANPDLSNPNVSVVRYGEYAYTDIRRFVVVQERRGFCLALPVSTYSQRGCTKCPEKAREHGIIYTSEYEPQPITGEPPFIYQSIKIKPVTDDIYLHSASRINFAETKSIQTNVKVKEIGNVIDEHLNLLDLQWKQEQNRGWP